MNGGGIGYCGLALTVFLLACSQTTGPAAEKSCPDLGDSVAQANPNDPYPVFKVIQPNGGEIFKVGDTLHVRVTESLDDSNAAVTLKIKTPSGYKIVLIPPGTAGNLNVYRHCDLVFAIPDSLLSHYAPADSVGLVSDSVQVEVSDYNNALYNDVSDEFFSIKDST